MTKFKPLLASEADLDSIKYPVLASIKLDGIRCIIVGGQAVTRSLKPIPNRYIREMLSKPEFEGLDGEILCAEPTDPDCYRKTNSAVMSHDGEPEFTFWVFDMFNMSETYKYRLSAAEVENSKRPNDFQVLEHSLIRDRKELDEFEAKAVEEGHEGVMLRDPNGPYKFGRSTVKEGILLKVKRFAEDEAAVLEMVEELENTNEATKDDLGRTERSTHASGMVGKGTLGAVKVRDLKTGVEFHIGSGFTKAERRQLWQEGCVGRVVKYKHFPVGVKDLPRFPTFKGFRAKEDM